MPVVVYTQSPHLRVHLIGRPVGIRQAVEEGSDGST